MGCTGSAPTELSQEQGNTTKPLSRRSISSRETRIIQEEEVDVFINDEYDAINKNWIELHGPFLLKSMLAMFLTQSEDVRTLEVEGEWKSGQSAGGSRNNLEQFSTNPQYLLSVGPPESHPTREQLYLVRNRNYCGVEVSVCLVQDDLTYPPYPVALFVYKTDGKEERLSAEYFLCTPPEGDTGAFVNWRQVHQRFKLPPGLYVIIPALFWPDKERKFTMTIKAPSPVSLRELKEEDLFSRVPEFKSHGTSNRSLSYGFEN